MSDNLKWRRRRHAAVRPVSADASPPAMPPPLGVVVAAALGALLGALALVSCSPSRGVATSSTGPTSTSTSTTTTTLPVQVALPGSQPQGALSFMGPVLRVDVGSVQFGFRSFGSGPVLVLIPAEGEAMSAWSPDLLKSLSDSYKVVVFDVPGVGYSSDVPSAPMTVPWLAERTAELITALGLGDDVTLVGWGLGGQIALSLAESHAHNTGVRRLVLVGTSAGGPGAYPPVAPAAAILEDPRSTALQRAQLLFGGGGPAAASALAAYEAQQAPGYVEPVLESTITRQVAAEAAMATDPTIASHLGHITVPALIIAGDQDAIFPPQDSGQLAAGLPDATKIIVAGQGNGVAFSDESVFLAQLQRFMR